MKLVNQATENVTMQRAMLRRGFPTSVALMLAVITDLVPLGKTISVETIDRLLQDATAVPRYRYHAESLSRVLGVPVRKLFPGKPRTSETTLGHLHRSWDHRHDVPDQLLLDLIEQAKSSLDWLLSDGLYLLDRLPDLPSLLRDKIASGCGLRLIMSDPESRYAIDASQHLGLPRVLSNQIDNSLARLAHLSELAGLEVRLHRAPWDAGIMRFDDQLIVMHGYVGVESHMHPVDHIVRSENPRRFDWQLERLNAVAARSEPWRFPSEELKIVV